MNIRQCGRVSMLLLGGLGSGFASLVSVGPMNFSTPGIASLPAVLAIQHTGTASGCVGFFGGADITGLAACPGGFTGDGGNELTGSLTGTQTIAQLNAAGVTSASNLLLVLNSGEPGGGPLTLQDLALVFFNPTAGTTFTATLPATPLLFSSTAAGSGQGGFAFRLDATEAAFASAFFSGSDNRAGVAATVSGSAGGLDRFVFAAGSSPTAIPEPHQLPILFSGLSAMALIRMAARRKKAG